MTANTEKYTQSQASESILCRALANEQNICICLKDSLTHLKDSLQEEEQSGVAYTCTISCAGYNDLYIGETGRYRYLKTREGENQVNVKKGEVEKSAIVEHAWNHGYQIDWDSAKALDHQSYLWSRGISIYGSQE